MRPDDIPRPLPHLPRLAELVNLLEHGEALARAALEDRGGPARLADQRAVHRLAQDLATLRQRAADLLMGKHSS